MLVSIRRFGFKILPSNIFLMKCVFFHQRLLQIFYNTNLIQLMYIELIQYINLILFLAINNVKLQFSHSPVGRTMCICRVTDIC